jgi:hypothetical protein
VSLVFQQVQREGDIVSSQSAAVVERDSRAQQKAIGETVCRYRDGACSESVHGIGLILSSHHKTCERELHALGGIALEYEAFKELNVSRF